VRSSARLWGAAAAILLLSVSLKLAVGAPAVVPEKPAVRVETLRRFLATTPAADVEAVASGPPGSPASGWRFQAAGCRAAVFPSEKRGAMDSFIRARGRSSDRVAFVYRGRITAARPTWALARDVILHRATSTFFGGAEPGYVVVTYAKTCAGPPGLPWDRMPAI